MSPLLLRPCRALRPHLHAASTAHTNAQITRGAGPKRTFILPNLSALGDVLGGGKGTDEVQTYHERKILPYSRAQLYNLVADVPSYHRFIPYCVASRLLSGPVETPVLDPSTGSASTQVTSEAELTVGFMGVEERYVSEVVGRPYEMVRATATSQIPLFKSLTTTWSFSPAAPSSPHPSSITPPSVGPLASSSAPNPTSADADPHAGPTLLTIDLAYSFASPLHAALAAAFFEKVSGKMVGAFERRCLEVYGPGKA